MKYAPRRTFVNIKRRSWIKLFMLFLLTGCYGDQFECGSGECLHKKLQCDDYVDCDDGSDENADMCGKINT